MKSGSLRRWSFIHTWSSLICTLFILISFLSGLPLLFRDQVDNFFCTNVPVQQVPPGTPLASLDKVVANGLLQAPDQYVQFIIWDREGADVIVLGVGQGRDSPSERNKVLRLDAHTATFLDAPDITKRISHLLLRLHSELFAGLVGTVLIGAMALLFVIAVVSGVVVYGPSMRKLDFGAMRRNRSSRILWLDMHNLTGAALIVWTLVVGLTGFVNTWTDLALKSWQKNQLREIVELGAGDAITPNPIPVQTAVDIALKVAPNMTPLFLAYPGSAFSTRSHYVVFLRGDTPLKSRLIQPVVIDAATGALAGTPAIPWYIKALLLSQPLHFADYGGLALRLVWALLDVLTIGLLGTGLYLWVARRKSAHKWRAKR